MKEPITKDMMDKWEQAIYQAGTIESVIKDRISYILEVWFRTFGTKLTNWYFDNAPEGDVGNLSDNLTTNSIVNIYTECNSSIKDDMVIINKDGDQMCWESEIPLHWLFEPFEDEIINGKELYEEKEALRLSKRKEQSAQKKLKDKALAAAAKSKLSKEELAALRREL